ncbi:hypothetical protein [Paeniglutamicibacter antarcticus]|uniref:Uncharacterized protein n=1 Tax=Paeniglutamicibacter antarcticus TaxID=494023 RepID=A0ABP9TNG1_9MICC
MTEIDPEDYDQSSHRLEILTATYDLWERIKTERPELGDPAALRPVMLKCSKRHDIMAVKIRTHGLEGTEPNVNFEILPGAAGANLTTDSRPTAHLDNSPGNVIADLERVTIQCPVCRVKNPKRNIVLKADSLLLRYVAALATGKKSIVLE